MIDDLFYYFVLNRNNVIFKKYYFIVLKDSDFCSDLLGMNDRGIVLKDVYNSLDLIDDFNKIKSVLYVELTSTEYIFFRSIIKKFKNSYHFNNKSEKFDSIINSLKDYNAEIKTIRKNGHYSSL